MVKQGNQFFQSIILIFCTIFNCSVAIATQTRVALVVGNGAYKTFPQLKNPTNDASDIAKKLSGFNFDVEILVDIDKRSMEEAITRFGNKLRQKDAVGLFYFAGHGVQVNGYNYLIPIGAQIADESDVIYEAVDANRVLSKMELAKNNLNLLILDACRNNPFPGVSRSASRGLAKMNAPRGSMILYATSPGMTAIDGDVNSRNGMFTGKLLTAMNQPGLKIYEVFQQTALAVDKASQSKQIPYIEGVILGDFYFNNKVISNTQADPDLSTTEPNAMSKRQEISFWESIDNTPSKEGYKLYLNQYPTGLYRSLAQFKIDQIYKQPTRKPVSSLTNVDPNQAPIISVNSIEKQLDLKFSKISAGCFKMGSNYATSDQKPVHEVCLEKDYWISKYELTQAQWKKITGTNPSYFKNNPDNPVEQISWNDIQNFLAQLNKNSSYLYRLPTEAEWEYACKGNNFYVYCGNNDELDSLAWHGGNTEFKTTKIGQKMPNQFDLYDMNGNVSEWVADKYGSYPNGKSIDPKGSLTGKNIIIRGGGWNDSIQINTSTYRQNASPNTKSPYHGFRLVMVER